MYLTSVLSTFMCTLHSVPILLNVRADVLLCNGPGTCVPFCVVAAFLDIFLLQKIVIVYVESFCRTEHLSLSAEILYQLSIADKVLVQWPKLKLNYPRTEYLGRVL